MKELLTLLGFFIAGILFVSIRTWIIKKTIKNSVKTIVENGEVVEDPTTVLEVSEEKPDVKKFTSGMFSFLNPVLWLKDISSLFNLRKITIYLTIISLIFAYGWYRGTQGKPIKMDIGWGKEAYVQIDNDSFLHIDKKGNVYLEDKKGKKIKQISVKDVPGLKNKLAPIGFQLKPIIVGGYGVGDTGNSGFEIGAGFSFLRYWKASLEAFATNRGVYLGTSYSITDNSGIGIGVGKGYDNSNRGILYYRFNF